MFFFFKQKTAYELRISYWSSDVCSSDLQDEQIVVTGSRIRGGQTTSPITTISRRDAERAGQTDLGQVIRDLPQNFSGGQNPTIAPTGQGRFSNVYGSSTLNQIGSAAGRDRVGT